MIIDPHAARQDRSLGVGHADALDRGPFVANLIRALVRVEPADGGGTTVRSTGFTVGLVGRWGSGKSSVLYLLEQQLGRMDRVVVATFNPWLFKGRDELVQAYFTILRAALGRSPRDQAQALQDGLDRYRTAIDVAGGGAALYLDLHGGGGVATRGWQAIRNFFAPKPRTPDEERAGLETKLAKANVAVVILIDELDRVEDEEVRAVAQLIKAVGDVRGISYLVAYDHARVADALGRGADAASRQATGSAYLEKIIQFAVPLRPLFAEDVSRLLSEALLRFELALPPVRRDHERALLDVLVAAISTPREIKRLVGAFAVYEEVIRGEICPYDVLAYSWLATRLPDARQRIAEAPDLVVDDPATEELIRRMGRDRPSLDQRMERAFGSLTPEQRAVMQHLFPTFAEETQPIDGDRLSKRRNIIRLLFLGDPPGSLPRREIEAVWTLRTPEAVAAALAPYRDRDRLRDFLQRFADLLPSLPSAGDPAFWCGLSRALMRPHDWIETRESLGEAIEDAAQLLWNYGLRGEVERSRVIAIVDALVADGDLVLVPWLLRRNMTALGFGIYTDRGTDRSLWAEPAFEAMLDSEEPRYRAAITSGRWLRRVPDAELLYALPNAFRWDDHLRANLTAQLATMAAIATFAALTVRPGYVSTFESMNELVDAAAVATRVAALVRAEGLPPDAFLAASVRRLQATLTRRDPHYFEPDRGRDRVELDHMLFEEGRNEPDTGGDADRE